jgi:NAD(P)-dependent dehydrogenase (short-subunit alcohol dehydrogenase family)
MTTSDRTALVVGGYGMLGTAIAELLAADGWTVLRSSRQPRPEHDSVVLDALTIPELPVLDAVCWAQGANVNDAADSFTDDDLGRLLDANVVVPARQLRDLVRAGRLRDGGSVVLISSIWEQVARAGKFSYTISKAAVGGLVRAAALDLADRGIRVNGVLPGVVDSPMTRSMLSPAQLEQVAEASGHNRLVTAAEVANVVVALCAAGSGVTGQSLLVDLGFTVARRI